ncbi:DUF3035 domain-containing protein [Candidatus Pelagibacter sp.]|jgi:hypothetical protein|nr:DUF3035 domain-containing protein [Candidatus Pelagibacter sp.]
MNKINSVIVIFLTVLLLNACSRVAEGLAGNKKKGSDEFLVEKKAPLVLPPSFGELPEPGKKKDKNIRPSKEEALSIEDMIKKKSLRIENKKDNDSNNATEKSIIDKINEQ